VEDGVQLPRRRRSRAEDWVAVQALALLAGHAARVADGIEKQADAARLRGEGRYGADACVGYLRSKREFLRYDLALAAGWPIATGVIEGACRHLIADRLDISGARWGLAGAEAVLKLRAVDSNGDFDAYFRYHLAREHQRVHQDRYALSLISRLIARGCTRSLRPPAQRQPPGDDLAVTDAPALAGEHQSVFIGHAAARSVPVDSDALGTGVHLALASLREDDVRHVMTHGIRVPQGDSRRSDGLHPRQRLLAEVRDVVDDIVGEQLVQPVQLSLVAQVTMHRDQLGDDSTVLNVQCHGNPHGPPEKLSQVLESVIL
jgi:hypothetical protein